MIKVFKEGKWEIIADRTGVKFRIEEDTLQFYHNGEWHEVSGSMKVAPVSNASVTANDEGNMITATWNNPINEEYSRTEVYISKNKIATTNPEVITKQAEKIYSGSEETVSKEAKQGEKLYVYFLAVHNIAGLDVYSDIVELDVTPVDKVPPAPVTDLKIISTDKTNTLSWVNPSNDDFKHVQIVFKLGSYPNSITDGTQLSPTSEQTYSHTGLTNDTEYFYRLFTLDEANNVNSDTSMQIKGTPISISSVTEVNTSQTLDGESLTVTWKNGARAISATLFASKKDISNLDYEACVTDAEVEEKYKGLDETVTFDVDTETTYHLKLFTEQEYGSKVIHDTGVHKQVATKDKQPPATITNFIANGLNEVVKLTWTNPTDKDFKQVLIYGKQGEKPSVTDSDKIATLLKPTESYEHAGLVNEEEYHYIILTEDTHGNVNEEEVYATATPKPLVSVSDVKGVKDLAGEEAVLTWKNPTEEFINVKVYKSLENLATKTQEECESEAISIYEGKAETVTTDTEPNKDYYFKVFTKQELDGAQVYDAGITVVVNTLDEKPPAPITEFSAKKGNTELTLTWKNPVDSDFDKVVIRRSTNDDITGDDSGELVYEGKDTSFTDTGLTNETTYYYRAFTYDTTGNKNDDDSMKVSGTPIASQTYTVIIDETNSNPETALTYADDAINLQPKSDEFLEFLGAKPCLLKEGKVVGYLNPNDFSKFEDGSTADITSGNAGDVMIEFPKRGIKIERKGTNLHVSMTDELGNADFSYMAHKKGAQEVDNIYIGAYKAFVTGGKMRSLSGKTPTANKTIGAFRTDAQANGEGYQQSQWYHLVYRQVAYILYTKNLDSQTAIGRGYVDGNSSALATGSTDKLGMVYGETTGKKSVKVFGIEDFWGNIWEWVDGLATSSSRDILITKTNNDYNNAGSNYQQYGKCFSKDGYIDKSVGDNNNGFLPETAGGSSSTYYADYAYQSSSGGKTARFGGNWNSASDAGAFCLNVYGAPSYSNSVFSARLSFS